MSFINLGHDPISLLNVVKTAHQTFISLLKAAGGLATGYNGPYLQLDLFSAMDVNTQDLSLVIMDLTYSLTYCHPWTPTLKTSD